MEQIPVNIRIASVRDAAALLAIYKPYVENTAVTFEYEVPSLADFSARIQYALERYPYLVAEARGELLGYAYAGPFKSRAAYDWAVETSIYIRQDRKRMGAGSRLYAALETALAAQGILNLNACIAYPEVPDEHLTRDSVAFHERLGYVHAGRFRRCGYKFYRWYDMVWMEKHIGVHERLQPPVRPFPDIRDTLSFQ